MTSLTKSSDVEWVESATKRTLNEAQARAIDVISRIDRPHNLRLINTGWHSAVDYSIDRDAIDFSSDDAAEFDPTPAVEFHERFVIFRLQGSMSTFDCARLTNLVLAAHARLVRVEISAETFVVEDRDGTVMERDAEGEWVATDRCPHYFRPCLHLQLNAREPAGRLFERHPDGYDLADAAIDVAVATTKASAAMDALRRGITPQDNEQGGDDA